ncbi:MAG: alanine/ornithine racemase family PLP-dependent enzyme [Fervidobacterium sp.]|nr:alanine/ornithine racemase family PLP-dependent enzyme [Fervidobacterium sp.]
MFETNYPRLNISLDKIIFNSRKIAEMCHNAGIELVGVTKLVLANPKIAKAIRENGVDKLGDSRLRNIISLVENNVPGPFQLLRIPMLSELPTAVKYVDEILVSMPATAYEIDKIALELQKNVQLIYMVDVGDLREGVWFENAVDEIYEVAKKLKYAKIIGVGTNVGCYGGVLPTLENMRILIEIKRKLENLLGFELKISGGSTVTLKMLENGTLPSGINQFRVGEGLILGTDATGDRDIPYLHQDTVILEAEVIEVDYKPSVPYGETGKDAFGRTPTFEDKGYRRRIIIAVGEQDVKPDGLKPLDECLKILHASSDHLIVDVTECYKDFRVGDIVKFRMSYGCALRAFTSPYVEKVFV